MQQEAWNGYIADVVPDAKLALDYTACKQQEILYDAGRSDIEPSEACADISSVDASRRVVGRRVVSDG